MLRDEGVFLCLPCIFALKRPISAGEEGGFFCIHADGECPLRSTRGELVGEFSSPSKLARRRRVARSSISPSPVGESGVVGVLGVGGVFGAAGWGGSGPAADVDEVLSVGKLEGEEGRESVSASSNSSPSFFDLDFLQESLIAFFFSYSV